MQITAQELFKLLKDGKEISYCLVTGDEPFQTSEVISRLKSHFITEQSSLEFNYETWDGEHIDPEELLSSLNTFPGLFSQDSKRLVVCRNFDRVALSGLEVIGNYLKNPCTTTFFLMLATKSDRRKSWYKTVHENGYVIEVVEPYDREWPKWHMYFEGRIKKRIEPEAWERLVSYSGKKLSLLWAELNKLVLYVDTKEGITSNDLQALCALRQGADIFAFTEFVLNYEASRAIRAFYDLIHSGESEIKILSILVRQFHLVEGYLKSKERGFTDSKVIAGKIGVSPYFIPKIGIQAKKHSLTKLRYETLPLLSEADYRLKMGEGGLFDGFLIPYFQDR